MNIFTGGRLYAGFEAREDVDSDYKTYFWGGGEIDHLFFVQCAGVRDKNRCVEETIDFMN